MFACNLKISAIAYLFSISFSTVFQQQRCQFFCQCFIIRYPGSVRPESHLPCAFMPCASEVNSNGHGFKRDIWNLALQPLKIYIHYCNACGQQTGQGGDLPWEAPTHKVTWPFDHVVLWDLETNWKHIPQPKCLCPPNLAVW